jgi:hypothetical protein
MRMLDNVIDINYYAVKKARDSNLRHRPVGLGIMGFQDALYQLRIPYASAEAVSSPTARWKPSATTPTGPRPSWPRSAAATPATRARCGTGHPAAGHAGLLAEARGGYVEVDRSEHAGLGRAAQRIARTACATPTAWPSRPRPPSPTSSASTPRSSRASATCRSSPTCRASSPSSTSTWCATSSAWACGTT